jgi:hypothetical protein
LKDFQQWRAITRRTRAFIHYNTATPMAEVMRNIIHPIAALDKSAVPADTTYKASK